MSALTESEQFIWSYRPTDAEFQERLALLSRPREEDDGEFLSKQVRCFSELNNHEKGLLAHFFTCIEGGETQLSYHLISRLYSSATMANEPTGLYAYAIASIASAPAAGVSIIKRATPLSAVAVDDWAYYAALALIKAPIQPDLAMRFLQLASLVPHCHEAPIKAVGKFLKEKIRITEYNILKHSEVVISSFKDPDTVRKEVSPLLELVKSDGSLLRNLREENDMFNRVYTRAQKRYYNYGWQFLEHPESQPASIWSKLPDEVIRHMACVADWSGYLKLASTCKLYHNRMNSNSVWHHVLEAKWDLDVTCFDEIIPRNPVTAVKQILGLLALNDHWGSLSGLSAPSYEIPQAIELVWTNVLGGSVAATTGHGLTETALRCLLCVIVGDNSGKLTRQLLEGGILEFVMNVIRTDTAKENSELALGVLSLLYVRNRYTCAFMSRYMAPTVARVFALTRVLLEEQRATAYGLVAAVAASQVLYPNAHSHAIPLFQAQPDLSIKAFPRDFEEVSKAQAGDFVAAAVEPSYASLLTAGLAANDDVDAPQTVELEADKVRFNMDNIRALPHTLNSGEMMEVDDGQLEEPSAEEEAGTVLAMSYQSYFDEQDEYDAAIAAELANKAIAESSAAEEDAAGHEDSTGAPKQESKPKRTLEPHHQSVLPSHKRLLPRFAAAEAEWQLFVVFDDADCENVLHRGILRMTLTVPPDEDAENHTGILHVKGYWTVDANDTRDTIADNALSNHGNYSPIVGHRNESAAEASTTKKVWLDNHIFEFETAEINLESGMVTCVMNRPDGVQWVFDGSGLMLGYVGGISVVQPEEEPYLIGGFLLLKPEYAEPSAVGKADLNAYERLAHLSLKVGALTEPSDSAFPQSWDEEPEELAQEMEEEGAHLDVQEGIRGCYKLGAEVCMTSVNHTCFDTITQNELELPLGEDEGEMTLAARLIFSLDPIFDFPGSSWSESRRHYMVHAYNRLISTREALCLSCRTEARADLETLRAFQICNKPIYDPGVYLCAKSYGNYLNNMDELLDPQKDDLWRTALTIHYKWVARLALFEVAGMPDVTAMQFTLSILDNFDLSFGHFQ